MTDPDSRIRVVIIDDEALIRHGLTLILEAADDITVVGVGDGADAERLVRKERPDVVMLDIRMPAPDGISVLRALQSLPDAPKVVMLTTFDMDEYVTTAVGLGASGYLLKDTDPEHLPAFVRTAAAGGVVLGESPARRMLRAAADGRPDDDARRRIAALTERERDVLICVARGASNSEIGQRLHMGVGTVKDHVSSVLGKLDVPGRVPAALLAERAGLLREEQR